MKKIQKIVTFLILGVMMLSILSSCTTPTPPAPQVVKEVVTQIVEVEKTVEVVKEVVKEVVVTPTAAPKAAGVKTIIRVGTGDSGEGLNPHQEIINNFEKENPDIIVQLEAVAGADYYARLLAQIAADDAPDIIQIGDDAVPMFVSKGAFLPLDDFIKGADGIDPSIYLPNTLAPGVYKGKQYFMPKDFATMGVYYNKKIFDLYKVPYPQDGWTWDDFLKTAQALTIDENKDGTPEIYGVQLMANWNGYEYFTASTGAKLISDDGKSIVGYMDSAESVKAVQFYIDMYNKYKVAPPVADFNQWAGGNTEFETGKAAMRLFGTWPQGGYLTNPLIDLGLVKVPVGDKKANIMFWGGFGIYSGTKNPEAVWKFLKYYTGKGGSEVWIKRGIPPVASVVQAAGMEKDPISGVWISSLSDVVNRAYMSSDFWGETGATSMGKALEKLLIDPTADVATTLKEAAVEAQAALDEKLK